MLSLLKLKRLIARSLCILATLVLLTFGPVAKSPVYAMSAECVGYFGIATTFFMHALASCPLEAGFCLKHFMQFTCTGARCVDCCFGSNYECGSIGLFQTHTCCQKINNRPPTDNCKINSISQGGNSISYLEKDCQIGKTCPLGGTGQCQNCDGTYTGICYKDGNGPLFNACCPGFTCPKEVNGPTACVSAELLTKKFIKLLSGVLYPTIVLIGMFIIVINGYKMMTSQGDPNKLQVAKESLTSAIIGLLFILLAVSVMRVIIMSAITGDVDPFG